MRHNSPHSIRLATSMLASVGFLLASWTPPTCASNHNHASELFHLTSHSEAFLNSATMPPSYEPLTESSGLLGMIDHVFGDLLAVENMLNIDVVNFLRSLDGTPSISATHQESTPYTSSRIPSTPDHPSHIPAHVHNTSDHSPVSADHPAISSGGHLEGTTVIANSLPRLTNTHNIVPPLGVKWNPPRFNIDNDQNYLSPWVEHASSLGGPYHSGLGNTVQIGIHDILGYSPWRNAGQNSADAAQIAFSGQVNLGNDDIIVGNYTTYGHGLADSMISSCTSIDSCTGGVVQIGSDDDIGFNPQIGQFPWNVANGVGIDPTHFQRVGTGADILGPHITIGDQDILGNHVRLVDLPDSTELMGKTTDANAYALVGDLQALHDPTAHSALSMNIDNDVTIYGSQFAQGGAYTLLSGNINVDPNTMIGADSQILNTNPDSILTIGIDDIIGMDSVISSSLNPQDWVSSHVIVDPNVHIGTAVLLGQADHLETGSTIGNDVYLPPGVTLAPGVSIGAHNMLPASIFTPGTVIDTDINAGTYNTPLAQALPSAPETVNAVDLANNTTQEIEVSESLVHGVIPITMQTGSLNDPDLLAQVNASVDQVGFLEKNNPDSGSSSQPQDESQEIALAPKVHSFAAHLPADSASDHSATTQEFDQFLQAWEDLGPNMLQQSLVGLLGGHGSIGNLNLSSLSITHDQPTTLDSSSLGTVTDQGIEGFLLHSLKGLSLLTDHDNSSVFTTLFDSLDKEFSGFDNSLWQFETHTDTSIINAETSLLNSLSDDHLTDPWADWIGHQLEGLNMLLDAQDQFVNSIIGLTHFVPNDLTHQLLISGLPAVVSSELLSNGDIGGIEGFIDQELAADVELADGISDL